MTQWLLRTTYSTFYSSPEKRCTDLYHVSTFPMNKHSFWPFILTFFDSYPVVWRFVVGWSGCLGVKANNESWNNNLWILIKKTFYSEKSSKDTKLVCVDLHKGNANAFVASLFHSPQGNPMGHHGFEHIIEFLTP